MSTANLYSFYNNEKSIGIECVYEVCEKLGHNIRFRLVYTTVAEPLMPLVNLRQYFFT